MPIVIIQKIMDTLKEEISSENDIAFAIAKDPCCKIIFYEKNSEQDLKIRIENSITDDSTMVHIAACFVKNFIYKMRNKFPLKFVEAIGIYEMSNEIEEYFISKIALSVALKIIEVEKNSINFDETRKGLLRAYREGKLDIRMIELVLRNLKIP
ncbi:hypothetical protein AGMMS49938_09740 [Fibrobacterales bacterium]|nr:hypothetical protein AGMMS49938_09740 [Fibrobacterales bacterium]